MALLGLIQGLTEFLPISSSGHLVLATSLIGETSLGVREVVFLHVGTLFGLAHFFRRDLVGLAAALLPGPSPPSGERRARLRIVLLVGLGTAVTGALALLLEEGITAAFDSLFAVSGGLLVTAGALAWSSRAGAGERGIRSMLFLHATAIGLVQAAATWPGISRSGSTIAAGMLLGYRREEAARFSFLLALPIIAAAAAREAWRAAPAGDPAVPIGAVLLGGAVAAASGWAALYLLFRILRSATLLGFAYYCFAASVLALALGVAT